MKFEDFRAKKSPRDLIIPAPIFEYSNNSIEYYIFEDKYSIFFFPIYSIFIIIQVAKNEYIRFVYLGRGPLKLQTWTFGLTSAAPAHIRAWAQLIGGSLLGYCFIALFDILDYLINSKESTRNQETNI